MRSSWRSEGLFGGLVLRKDDNQRGVTQRPRTRYQLSAGQAAPRIRLELLDSRGAADIQDESDIV